MSNDTQATSSSAATQAAGSDERRDAPAAQGGMPTGSQRSADAGAQSYGGSATALSQRDPRAGSGTGTHEGSAMTPYSGLGYGNPFALMRRLSDEVDRMFETFGMGSNLFGRDPLATGSLFGSMPGGALGRGSLRDLWSPHLEVCQRGDKLLVQIDLPGVRKEDVNVQVEQDQIVIQGERRQQNERNARGIYHSERSYGTFHRAIRIPEGVDADSARATFRDGVLEIELDAPRQRGRGRTLQIHDAGAGEGAAAIGADGTPDAGAQGSATATGVSGGGSSGGKAGSV